MYPVVAFKARYGGAYEGAEWVAFNEFSDSPRLDGSQGDDLTCAGFFRIYESFKPIGRGSTAQEAVEDLYAKMETHRP